MRIYISGKITGDENYREKFSRAEEAIAENGHDPINPACLRLPKSCSWTDYMTLALAMLNMADIVCLLPDWKDSPGTCVEVGYAVARGKCVVHVDQLLARNMQTDDPVQEVFNTPQPKEDPEENGTNESKSKNVRICPVCGRSFAAVRRQIYCSADCRNLEVVERKKARHKPQQEKKEKKKGQETGNPVNDCPNDCKYMGKSGSLKTCDYLLITGDPRESDMRPGGCDRYEVRR